jgi:hypothetical protein
MEVLAMQYQPIRYVVTNTEKVILVTHDYKFACKIAERIKSLTTPRDFYVRVNKF